MYLLITVIVVVCALYYVRKVRRSRMREVVFGYPPCFPESLELPIVGSLYHFIGNAEDALKTFIKLGCNTMKAGDITRIYGCNKYCLVLTDRTEVKEVLSTYLDKDKIYSFLQVLTGNGSVFVPEYSISKVRRQAMLPAFSSNMLVQYTPKVWKETDWLIDTLGQHVGKGPFSAEKYISAFCYHTLISVSNGEEFKGMVSGVELLSDFYACFNLVYERFTSLWMHADFVYKFTSNHRKIKKHVATFYKSADMGQELRRQNLVNNMQKGNTEEIECGFIDSMIHSGLSRHEINEEIMVFVGAMDEGSLAIGFLLLLLAQYPAVQDKLYEEIKEIFPDSEKPLGSEDLTRMQYLDMVIKETMRLYPPIPLILRKADKERTLSSGRIIPADIGLVIPIISIHRNPEYWGPDAEHFDPERFLPERLARVPDNAYIPFSSGPRSCPGYKFVSNVVKVGVCAILRKYKVVGTPATSPVPDIRAKIEVVLKTVNHVEIQLENRDNSSPI